MARQPDNKTKSSSDDSALIRELALLLDETSLTEIEIERAGLRVRVARNISVDIRFLLWLLKDVQHADGILTELGVNTGAAGHD